MRTLLLADDSVTTQRVVALTFAEESFRVVTVSDGQQAIEAMAAMRPDIVLAGTTLPRTNGYELAEHMRGDAKLREVPVLLLSGAFESVDMARLKVSGARGVVEKPLEPTAVISRVRELLGLKDTRPAPPAGRLVTSADTPSERRQAAAPAAVRQAPVASWDDLREESGLPADAPSVEGGAGRADYLDTLDAAFDSLDQHLAGRNEAHPLQRNPSPPIGQAAGAPDPRSPGRRPAPHSLGGKPNSVFEVDDDWFADDKKTRDTAARQEMAADAHEALPSRPAATPGKPIFEVDDDWFADNDKATPDRAGLHRDLAAEMGIRDLDLPPVESLDAPASAAGSDFDFGLDDILADPATKAATPEPPVVPPPPAPRAVPTPVVPPPVVRPPVAVAPPPVALAPMPRSPLASAPVPVPAPVSFAAPEVHPPAEPSSVADDFAALLAFETGDAPPAPVAPAVAAAPVTVAAAPEITDGMLDQIAQRVADRLNAGTFGTHLRDAMASTVRETVRSVVSETSERLVRDEIARIKGRAERETP